MIPDAYLAAVDDVRDSTPVSVFRLRDRVERAQREYQAALTRAVVEFTALGLTTRQVAEKVGVSHQRVSQILRGAT